MAALAMICTVMLIVLSFILILVVLLQRGRGGGLAGALGGGGSTSAFGTKSGDVFTKITIGIAAAWFILAGVTGIFMRNSSNLRAAEADEGRVTQQDEVDGLSTGEDDVPQVTAPEAPFGEDEVAPAIEPLEGTGQKLDTLTPPPAAPAPRLPDDE